MLALGALAAHLSTYCMSPVIFYCSGEYQSSTWCRQNNYFTMKDISCRVHYTSCIMNKVKIQKVQKTQVYGIKAALIKPHHKNATNLLYYWCDLIIVVFDSHSFVCVWHMLSRSSLLLHLSHLVIVFLMPASCQSLMVWHCCNKLLWKLLHLKVLIVKPALQLISAANCFSS